MMTERAGIEIDYCPQCRGVWLDRGELDKIIERSTRETASYDAIPNPQPQVSAPSQQHGNGSHRGYINKHHEEHRDEHYDERQGYRNKHSFWKELFD
jgi:Zn-finger nucleic acid-binding protein